MVRTLWKIGSVEENTRAWLTGEAGDVLMQDQVTEDNIPFLTRYRNDLISLVSITVLIVCIFSSTLFSGNDISRAGTIAHRDTVFGRLAKGDFSPMDTCIYQEHLPSYFLTERVIAGGNMPLWNPYAGFGSPLLSDCQVLALSPITWLQAPFASLRLYNLLMVFQLWAGCVSAYFLARVLKISPAGSLLSSVSFVLSPYILYMYEWNRCQNALFSLPFLGFAWHWKKETPSSIVVCALLCSALIYSGHVSPTFFAIGLAALMYLLLANFCPNGGEAGGHGDFLKSLRGLLVAGGLTFLLSAPFLVPFVETLRVSETFKSELPNLRYVVSAFALLPSLFYPFHGAGSPYLGAVSILLCLSAPFVARREKKLALLFAGLTLLTAFAMIRVGPFDLLFQLPFLKWLMLVYAVPALLLFMAVLSGYGYDAFAADDSKLFPIRKAIVLAIVALIPICLPHLISSIDINSADMRLNDWLTVMTATSSVKVRELVFILIAVVLVFSLAKAPSRWREKIALAMIVLNFLSLAFVFRNSIPARPAFQYEEVDPIPFLKKQGRRIINMGRHVFVPNTGQVFGISQVLSFFPNHPRGVTGYLRSLGISIEGLGQYAEKPLTKLADIGAIKYAVASEPVLSLQDKLPEPLEFASGAIEFGSRTKLKGVALSIDTSNSDIIGRLNWSNLPDKNGGDKFLYVSMIVRPDGSLLWVGDRHTLPENTIFAASIPKHLKEGEQVCLILQVIDSSTGQLVEPINAPAENLLKPVPKSLLLKSFTVPGNSQKKSSAGRHFKLVQETAPEMVRVYENTGALPEAYVVYRTRLVSDVETALRGLLSADFNARTTALTEGLSVLGNSADGHDTLTEAKVRRPNVNEVIIEVECADAGLLVMTDVFFPGWRVFVDGNEGKIFRTNAIFRGVRLDKGRHIVRFLYDPPEVKLGFLLAALGLASIVFLLRFGRQKKPLN